MDRRALKLPRGSRSLALAVAAGLAGLGLLTQAMQNSGTLGRWHDLILVANVLGGLALAGVLVVNLVSLAVASRRKVPGAALKLRLLVAFAAIATAPVLVVFLVAVQFLHRGIETWTDDSIGPELERSLQLSRTALDPLLRDALEDTRAAGERLAGLPEGRMIEELPAIRARAAAQEMTVFARNYRIVATSSEVTPGSLPVLPSEDVLLQLPRSGSYVAVEPDGGGRLRVRAAVTLGSPPAPPGELLIVQALYPVSGQLGALAGSVQKIYTRYGESLFLREPLESGFTVALGVVLLLALFTALYGALVFARRLVAPIRNLVAGTRAIAAGDLDTHLPVPSRDDIGTLVESFNEMAARLNQARAEAERNAGQIDRARASLAAVLARLTSGVIAVDGGRCLRMANDAADEILHAGLKAAAGSSLEELSRAYPHLGRFFEACEMRGRASPEGWREQLVLGGEGGGRRTLMCSAAPLPLEGGTGYVLVFDDITGMLQAQREAAWGEVARRLAHEIKNPLTPIQLSAERIRRRYLGTLPAAEAEILDRATHTIVQQVEALRDMVNAFGEYARAPEVSFAPLDLNRLVREVADLYHGPQQPELRLALDENLGSIEADAVRLRQLLHNLIRNACEALEHTVGARVDIGTARVMAEGAPAVEIGVSDNGPGIDPALLERIFDPYVTSKTRGTGLGLAIVRRLVEEHGGTILAANLPGGGARVTVTLPVSQQGRDVQADVRLRRAGDRR
jgi:nitrogen fixation/metabolism regulation signal transduction histidine kinase